MSREAAYVDAYGAPEFFITGLIPSLVCDESMRLACIAEEDDGRILRAKLLIPTVQLVADQRAIAAFIAGLSERSRVVM